MSLRNKLKLLILSYILNVYIVACKRLAAVDVDVHLLQDGFFGERTSPSETICLLQEAFSPIVCYERASETCIFANRKLEDVRAASTTDGWICYFRGEFSSFGSREI